MHTHYTHTCTHTLSPARTESEQQHKQNCLSPISPPTVGNDLSDLGEKDRKREREKKRTDGQAEGEEIGDDRQPGESANRDAERKRQGGGQGLMD